MPIFIVESYRDGKPIEVVGAFSTRELANAFIIEHMRFDTPVYYRINATYLNTESLNNDE
jgi:ribosomal protein S16